jgi:5'-phosphate synthase pdxT subunit
LAKNIGILALQGDFSKHTEAVKKLGHNVVHVRNTLDLDKCDSLIIPGGESTTFMNLIERLKLRDPIVEFNKNHPIMGTCAGLIIVASEVDELPFKPLNLIPLKASRNAYGRQINSFVDRIELKIADNESGFEGVFIRAPKIVEIENSVTPLAYYKEEIVMAANESVLVASFHPELTDDLRIHQYFINKF